MPCTPPVRRSTASPERTQANGEGGSARDPAHTRELVRDTTVFNRYFTAGQYGAVQGQFEAGKVDNSYSMFEAGGVRRLVLTLALWPRVEAVNWARSVVATNPRHSVIVVTHGYIDDTAANSLRTWTYAPHTKQSFTEYHRSVTGLGWFAEAYSISRAAGPVTRRLSQSEQTRAPDRALVCFRGRTPVMSCRVRARHTSDRT
ncbi:hypothetical protein [Micromonospora sp. DH14]|uniref:hypothetical protein n=1 Tax=Micromonospora sp. DH14 TaxID=3040120 RepID=UPI0024411A4C|nr:hypothetical protein [Micromonospora sp. DH14]MDG9674449.1 hypothetical protein [Micromonospora sp. DH14]